MKRTIAILLVCATMLSFGSAMLASAKSGDDIVITLDPGYGPGGGGSYKWDGKTHRESEIVLKIAYYLKDELESHKGVKVYLTRETNEKAEYEKIYELENRCAIAEKHDSDVFVSLHLNGSTNHEARGASVLIPSGNYRPKLAAEDKKLASYILDELTDLGIGTRGDGYLVRYSEKTLYPDGSRADYYGIVRGGVLMNIPTVLIEHCFLDNYDDFSEFLSSDKKLKALARADARGIMKYLEGRSDDVSAKKSGNDVVITIDAGHGPGGGGSYKWDGKTYRESEIVLKIAYYLKEELESYAGVKVYLTRETNDKDEYEKIYELEDRCKIAEKRGSDVFVSLHLNGSESHKASGASVLIPNGNYRPKLAAEDKELASCILKRLRSLGLGMRGDGYLVRTSEEETYPDGSRADYYGIVRGGVLMNIPTVLIEHCFLDNRDDFNDFLSSDKKLKALARADAKGIAEYLGL